MAQSQRPIKTPGVPADGSDPTHCHETSSILLVTPVLVKHLRALTMSRSCFWCLCQLIASVTTLFTSTPWWSTGMILTSSILPLRRNKQMLMRSRLIQRVVRDADSSDSSGHQITHPSTLMYYKDKGFSSALHELLIASWHRPGTWTCDQENTQYSLPTTLTLTLHQMAVMKKVMT